MNVFGFTSNPSEPVAEVSEHLQDLLERSAKELDPSEREKLAELLTEFQDVFARSEFDFGGFTALEHEIDTGDAHPIKERMRRTPYSPERGSAPEENARCWSDTAVNIPVGVRPSPHTKERRTGQVVPGLSEVKQRDEEGRVPLAPH
jgi:hypothetical protein